MEAEQQIELATAEIAKIDLDLKELSNQMGKLSALRTAWITIRDSIRPPEIGNKPVTVPLGKPKVQTPINNGVASNYGDKTNGLRKFIIDRGALGATRSQIVEEAKRHDVHLNFPYRFISRMITAGEMIEQNGKFFCTKKMEEKL